MYQKVSFIIPVLNAERHLVKCLGSIRSQDYPRDRVEIVVLDGGSTDSTVRIAGEFDSVVLPNPKRLAEYGLQVGIKNATGDLIVIFAADNELQSREWLKKATAPFASDKGCSAVWGPLKSGAEDPPLNKYFELIQSDPMTNFLNRNLANYLKSPETEKMDEVYLFTVDPKRPLPWGANGLVLKREIMAPIWAQDGYLGDNDAFQKMVELGWNRVAYVPALATYHHHVGKIGDWVRKWKRNFTRHFLDKIETRNTNWVFVEDFKKRLLLWVLYSSVPLISGAHAIFLGIRDKNPYWAYHPLLCFLQTCVYTYYMVFSQKGRGMVLRIIKGETRKPVLPRATPAEGFIADETNKGGN